MKTILFFSLLISVAYSEVVQKYVDELGRPIEKHVASYVTKGADDVLYQITYDADILGGNSITLLDDFTGIDKVLCDANDIDMTIEFHSTPEAYALYDKIKDEGYEKYVISLKYNCSDLKTETFVNIKQVLSAKFINQNTILIRTGPGSYERLFRYAKVRADPIPDSEGLEKRLCLGINSNQGCTAANSQLKLYQDNYIDVTCTNCFIGVSAAIFFEFEFYMTSFTYFKSGLKGIYAKAGLVVNMVAKGAASRSLEKTFMAAAGVAFQFAIGPVPFVVSYRVPVRIVGEAKLQAKAFARVGGSATWNLGDAYVEWRHNTGWRKGGSSPSLSWGYELNGDVTARGKATLSIIPTVEISVGVLVPMISVGLTLVPSIIANIEGNLKKRELCSNLSYRIAEEIYSSICMIFHLYT